MKNTLKTLLIAIAFFMTSHSFSAAQSLDNSVSKRMRAQIFSAREGTQQGSQNVNQYRATSSSNVWGGEQEDAVTGARQEGFVRAGDVDVQGDSSHALGGVSSIGHALDNLHTNLAIQTQEQAERDYERAQSDVMRFEAAAESRREMVEDAVRSQEERDRERAQEDVERIQAQEERQRERDMEIARAVEEGVQRQEERDRERMEEDIARIEDQFESDRERIEETREQVESAVQDQFESDRERIEETREEVESAVQDQFENDMAMVQDQFQEDMDRIQGMLDQLMGDLVGNFGGGGGSPF